MHFIKSSAADLGLIFKFYDYAIAYQKTVFNQTWASFDLGMVEKEIAEGRQWQIQDDAGTPLCIFATTETDADIWGEKNNEPSIYLHRIVTHPEHHGGQFMPIITAWAKAWAQTNGKDYVRLDTWGNNDRLVNYYIKCGFDLVGTQIVSPEMSLPKHYNGISLALLEIKIGK